MEGWSCQWKNSITSSFWSPAVSSRDLSVMLSLDFDMHLQLPMAERQ